MEGDDGPGASRADEAVLANGSGEKRSKAVVSREQIDVEAYAGLYSGRTKVMRLFFMEDHCGNEEVQVEALRMAYDEIKKGENTLLHCEVVQKIAGRLGPAYDFDQRWVDAIEH